MEGSLSEAGRGVQKWGQRCVAPACSVPNDETSEMVTPKYRSPHTNCCQLLFLERTGNCLPTLWSKWVAHVGSSAQKRARARKRSVRYNYNCRPSSILPVLFVHAEDAGFTQF